MFSIGFRRDRDRATLRAVRANYAACVNETIGLRQQRDLALEVVDAVYAKNTELSARLRELATRVELAEEFAAIVSRFVLASVPNPHEEDL